MPTNSVRIHAGNSPQISVRIQVQLWLVLDAKIWSWLAYSKTVTKKDSVVLLVAWTLSIRGSLCIWYSLQFTLRLRGATPTNRHPLQSCGFSREILWHSCLEVVMNVAPQCKYVSINYWYICTHIWKYFICGFVGDFGNNTGRKLKEFERTVTLSDRSYLHIHIES